MTVGDLGRTTWLLRLLDGVGLLVADMCCESNVIDMARCLPAEIFKHVEAKVPRGGKELILFVLSSGKGLCGGIHAVVTKKTPRVWCIA